MHVTRRRRSADLETFESLEPRQLLTTGFLPDGPVISNPGQTPSSIATADFDGDTKPDLVTAVGNDILFQKGGGGGKFGAARLIARLNSPAGLLAAGDFNGDGITDLFSVEKQTFRGWRRVLLNAGNANFTSASYARVQTLVETVTVGNIDFDGQDEVLLEGRSPWLVLSDAGSDIIGQAPDEIRVLDPFMPAYPGPTSSPPLPISSFRFIDRGIAAQGQSLAQPVIADLLALGFDIPVVFHNEILVSGRDDADPSQGFIQAYTYNSLFAVPLEGAALGDSAQVFSPIGNRMTVSAPVTSVAAADMNGDDLGDIVATTLLSTSPIADDIVGQGDYQAQTLLFPRIGDGTDLNFDAPKTLEFRTLSMRPGTRRTLVPEYRITGIADLNSDSFNDVGFSVVQEFTGGRNGNVRDAGFVQLIHPDALTLPPPGGGYLASFVTRSVTTGLSYESVFSRHQIFTLSDVRRLGRPDLIIADTATHTRDATVRILFNVPVRLIVPLFT